MLHRRSGGPPRGGGGGVGVEKAKRLKWVNDPVLTLCVIQALSKYYSAT